jgi:radical SAM protein with 4Fe4S-binding SPASM domain
MDALEITTIAGCSINCSYCPQDSFLFKYNSNKKKLSLEEFNIIINKLPVLTRIHFTGFSEPFFHKDCYKMVALCKERGHYTKISTTLYKASQDNINTILNQVYNKITLHLPVQDNSMNLVVNETYIQNIEKCLKSLKNIDAIVFFGKTPHPMIAPLLEKTQGKVYFLEPDYSNWNSRAGNVNGFKKIDNTANKTIKCAANKIKQHVLLPNGDVYLCCMDWNLEHRLGNLLENTYEDIVNSKEYKHIIDSLNNNKSGTLCWRCDHAITNT